ncbi:helix-turn-helix transcriptional regulator [Desertivirga xinjiangensis]|uniref:helix-turn-helix transcriptional regulator n=1 Tax=Desertivirga xinjiangensis TaxID=539206 RepID=UPI0021099468|nr:hypothetical protein [Pedobacter xinjiangensis]
MENKRTYVNFFFPLLVNIAFFEKGSFWLSLSLLLIVAIFVILWRLLKLKNRNADNSLMLHNQNEEISKLKQLVEQQRSQLLQTAALHLQLQNKSREVANSAMSVVFKNELFQKVRTEVFELKDSNGNKLGYDQLRKIDKMISEAINSEGDWNLFEKSFNDAHENFFKKLKGLHNGLAPNDLKLCAFLRMNMNSKEIASLLSISLRGVEIRRYRLRKKLKILHDKNLTEFLLEL